MRSNVSRSLALLALILGLCGVALFAPPALAANNLNKVFISGVAGPGGGTITVTGKTATGTAIFMVAATIPAGSTSFVAAGIVKTALDADPALATAVVKVLPGNTPRQTIVEIRKLPMLGCLDANDTVPGMSSGV